MDRLVIDHCLFAANYFVFILTSQLLNLSTSAFPRVRPWPSEHFASTAVGSAKGFGAIAKDVLQFDKDVGAIVKDLLSFASSAVAFAKDARAFAKESLSFASSPLQFAKDVGAIAKDAQAFAKESLSFATSALQFAKDVGAFGKESLSFASSALSFPPNALQCGRAEKTICEICENQWTNDECFLFSCVQCVLWAKFLFVCGPLPK